MKKTILGATLFVLVAAFCVQAQVASEFRVNIPFDFHVGATSLAAGQYDVLTTSAPGLMAVRSVIPGASIQMTTYPVGGGDRMPEKAKLVFHRYGDTYFLAQVWRRGIAQGGQLPTSKAEREIAKAGPALETVVALAR